MPPGARASCPQVPTKQSFVLVAKEPGNTLPFSSLLRFMDVTLSQQPTNLVPWQQRPMTG
jgi:hypothetical protein